MSLHHRLAHHLHHVMHHFLVALVLADFILVRQT